MLTETEHRQVSRRTLVKKQYGDVLHIAGSTGTLCSLPDYPEELIFTVPKNAFICPRCMALLEKENAEETARKKQGASVCGCRVSDPVECYIRKSALHIPTRMAEEFANSIGGCQCSCHNQ